MSEQRENFFEMLDDDDNNDNNKNNNEINKEENEKEKEKQIVLTTTTKQLTIEIERRDDNNNNNDNNNNSNNNNNEDNSTWTDVSSTKVKKVSLPSSSLTSKSDNSHSSGSNNNSNNHNNHNKEKDSNKEKDNHSHSKSSPAVSNKSNNNNKDKDNNYSSSTNDGQTTTQEPVKKKVLRFTRDELLALHRPTKCLPEMVDIPEVVTVESLEPECNKPFDPDEILKIWNNDANKAREGNSGRGRGRGRGRNGGDGEDNGYSHREKEDDPQDIWDDIDTTSNKAFDLADFSAATFKFSETAIKLTENTELYSKEGDETMESLMKEDHELTNTLDEESKQSAPKTGNEKGRNLLLQTLSVKTPTEPKVPFSPFKATIQASTDDTLLDELIEEDGVPLSSLGENLKNDDSITFDSADDLDIDSIIGGLTATISATTISTSSPSSSSSTTTISVQVSIPSNVAQNVPTPNIIPNSLPASVPVQVQTIPIITNQGAPISGNRPINPLHPAYIQQQAQAQAQAQQAQAQAQQQAQQAQALAQAQAQQQQQQNILAQNKIAASQVPPAQAARFLQPDKWIYRDPHGNIQGPFEMTAMRRWLESGYFKENLPIKMTRWINFHPLGIVYPNPESAFLGVVPEPILPNNPVVIHSGPPQIIQQQQQPQQQQQQQIIPQQSQVPQQQQIPQQQQQIPSRVVEVTPNQKQVVESDITAEDLIKGKRAIPKSTTLVVTPPSDRQEIPSNPTQSQSSATTAPTLTTNTSSTATTTSTLSNNNVNLHNANNNASKNIKKVETTNTSPNPTNNNNNNTVTNSTSTKDSQGSNNDASKQKSKQQQQPQQQQSKPNIVTSTTASSASSVTSESNNSDGNNNNNKKNDSQNANKKAKTTKKSSKDNNDGSDFSNNKKNDESSNPTPSAWTNNKKGRDGNESKALSLTEIQQQEEAAKKQHIGEHHPVENPPSSVRSFQLKNLLGVGGKEKGWTTNSSTNNNQSSSSLRDIQVEQEKLNEEKLIQQQLQQQHQHQHRTVSGPPALPQQSQWKAPAGTVNNSSAKSLVEIMEEEKNSSGSTQSDSKPGRPGSWAAKAGGPKGVAESSIPPNWIAGQSQKSNNELTISDSSEVSSSSKGPLPSPGKRVVTVTNNTSNSNNTNILKPSTQSQSSQSQSSQNQNQQQQQQHNQNNQNNSKKSNSSSSNNNNSNNNNNSVSAIVGGDTIVEWSLQQLKRLSIENKSSTEDMALIEFCLTLKSAVEIREYLADYLGSTPQVSQFATEFIRRKEGKQPTQLRSTAGGTALTATILEKDKKAISLPTESSKKKKQKGKGQEF